MSTFRTEVVAARSQKSLSDRQHRRGVQKLTDDDDHSGVEEQVDGDDGRHARGGERGEIPKLNRSGGDWALWVRDPVVVLVSDVVEHPHDQQVGQ